MFEKFFRKKNNQLDKIIESVNLHKENVNKIVEKIKIGQDFQSHYINILLRICDHFEFLIYKKDKNNLYEFSNVYHCVNFFKLEPECVNSIKGVSDIDIINSYHEKTGKEHTFYEVCNVSDNIIEESKQPENFIMGGKIGDNEIILCAKKIPLIKQNNFEGSIGISTIIKNTNENLEQIDCLLDKDIVKIIMKKNNHDFLYQSINNNFGFLLN